MLDVGCWILDGGCFAEYLYIKKYTFAARKNIYYLLSLIHYLLSKVPRLCKRFLSVRSAGVLFRAESVRAALAAAQTPLPMQPRKNPMKSQRFALIFRPVQKKGDNGRLKRRPYGFCFYYTPLWLNSSCFLHPSALLGQSKIQHLTSKI